MRCVRKLAITSRKFESRIHDSQYEYVHTVLQNSLECRKFIQSTKEIKLHRHFLALRCFSKRGSGDSQPKPQSELKYSCISFFTAQKLRLFLSAFPSMSAFDLSFNLKGEIDLLFVTTFQILKNNICT